MLLMVNCFAQFNPQKKAVTNKFFPDKFTVKNVTPALKNTKRYTNHKDLWNFINELDAVKPNYVTTKIIGRSQKDKGIPMVFITNPESNQNKVKLFIQGGLHGDEKASTEGVLYFMHQLINTKKYAYLLDRIVFGFIPMANIDGYESDMRHAANKLDLNRDQTKLLAPESIALKKAFTDFSPDVSIDFHEFRPYRRDFSSLATFGITSYHDVMFLYSGNLNVAAGIRDVIKNVFVKNAKNDISNQGLNPRDYITTNTINGELQFNNGSTSMRSSATNYALTNSISTLIEIRGVGIGRTSFKRRIHTLFTCALSYAQTAYDNVEVVKSTLAKAPLENTEVTLQVKPTTEDGTLKVIDLDKVAIWEMPAIIRNNLKPIALKTRKKPTAYLIDKSETAVIEKLKVLGATIQTLDSAKDISVQSYKVTSYKKDVIPYEKTQMQTVKTSLQATTISFPKGTYLVKTNQKNTNIICSVLEPETASGFVNFGIIKTHLGDVLPIYRIIK
ncbi:Peptidase [Tenacibaculum insulae]